VEKASFSATTAASSKATQTSPTDALSYAVVAARRPAVEEAATSLWTSS
jgi:hypothetical protein